MLTRFTIGLILFGVVVCGVSAANEVRFGITYRPRQNIPIPKKAWDESTKVWLGRSCVGEAGWNVDECIAIAWVYATRYKRIGRAGKFENIIKKYSAAVKQKSTHKRPWILFLNLKATRPERWPDKLNWKIHRPLWLDILSSLDEWAKGKHPNPVPTANHYGGPMDRPRNAWVKITPINGLKFGNTFYSSPF